MESTTSLVSGLSLTDAPNDFEAAHLWHVQIQHGKIGFQRKD